MTRHILTAAEMRAAEERAIAAGTSVETLMERAGRAAAEAIWRFAGPLPALVLCGPGNNGGDGYVIARALAERGVDVAVAAIGEPVSGAARGMRERWNGQVEALAAVSPRPLLIDALFGTGLARPLDPEASGKLALFAAAARVRVAVDLPSGIATDDGSILSPVPDFDLTITFQTLKPAHLLQPAGRHMGRIVVADIGIEVRSDLQEIGRPHIPPPGPDDHKYRRGYVLVAGGEMTGAAALAAGAAARAGAGYVVLAADGGDTPNAIIRKHGDDLPSILPDKRIGAVLVGPGLGRSQKAREKLEAVRNSGHPIVIDADALWLLAEMGAGESRTGLAITTPHAGEFEHVYGDTGDKVTAARAAASRCGDVVIYKGPDTVVAAPNGRAAIHGTSSHWLASAGTGDVLAGVVAARRAAGRPPFEAACEAVWLHGRAAELAGPGLIADDLIANLPTALADCL